jgi:CYTH domain-containing protein/CHAD domain-containing protein
MAYVLSPTVSSQRKVRRVVLERVDDALARLAGLPSADGLAVEEAVHEVRKRCKEVRGLARLVRPALGPRFTPFDRLVAGAAAELSSIRDAQALLGTLDRLLAASTDPADRTFDPIRAHQAQAAAAASFGVAGGDGGGDPRVESAAALLRAARADASTWKIPKGFSPLGDGLARTYRRGARSLADLRLHPTDERTHQWRKAVKQLWYQLRLLERASPTLLGPLVVCLDELADALGDDHDLALLVDRLLAEPQAYGGPVVVGQACELARTEQQALRSGALRVGATVYAESPSAFVERIGRYWKLTVYDGPETRIGGIETMAAARRAQGTGSATTPADLTATSLQAATPVSAATPVLKASPVPNSAPNPAPTPKKDAATAVERERKWLVAGRPEHLTLHGGTLLRQGYLAIDGAVSVRVRDSGGEGCTLTVKAGRGTVRTELEWPIEREVFDQAWPATNGRRVSKTRFRLPVDASKAQSPVIELDVFAAALEGLMMAEVEFADDVSMAAFVAPKWFGREVSDDSRYTNASLAVDGLDPSLFV